MESDILGSKRVERLHVDLDAKGELGLEGDALFSEPSAISKLSSDDAKMDDEVKSSGSKRRCSRIDVRIDFEDDDAPIGSLFKLKRTRNPKKTNHGFDAGKSGKVEVRAESLIVKDEDLGEMDDTLASFRKKLKVPKKEGRLGMLKVRNSASNAAKHLDQSSNECVEDLDLVAKSQSNKSLSPDDNGSYLSRDDRLDGSKGRSKRSKHASASEKTKVNSKSDDKSDRPVVRRSRESSKQKHREGVLGFEEGSSPFSERNFDDSLSTFVQKSQSSMARKTRSSSLSKQRVGTEVYEDGSKHMLSMIVQKSCLAPASKLGFKSKKSENVLDPLSDRSLKDPVPATVEAMKNGISDEDLSQASGCLKGNPLSSSVQELHPVPASMEEIVRSSYNTCDRSSEEIQDISVFTFPPSTTYSVSATHHKAHLTILHDDEFNRQTKGVHGGSTENCDGLRRDCDGVREGPLYVKAHDSCSAFIPKLTEETQRFKDGLKQCSKGKTNDLVHDAAELPSSVSATKKMGETNNRSDGLPTMISEDHPSSAVSNGDANLQLSSVPDDAFNLQKTQEAAGSSYDFDEQSIGVSEINLAATDENPSTASFSLPVTVNPVPCIDVDSLNKHSEETHKGNTMDKFNCLNKLANKSVNESTGPVERSSSLPLTSQRNSSVTCNEQRKPFEMSLEGSLTSPVRCRSLQQVEIEEAPVLESGPDQFSDGYSEDSQLIQPQSSFPACGLTKQEETCSILGDTNQTPCNCIEEPLLALSSMQSLQVEEAVGSNARLSASVMASNMVIKSGSASENNPWEKSLYNGDVLHNDSVTSIQTYDFACPQDQPSDDTSKGTCTTSHDSLAVKEEEAQGVCSPSITLDQNEICPEDAGMILDPEYKDIKLTAVQRVMRKAKRCKHGDMAYEGDTEWEILMHGQRCSESNRVVDGDQPFKIKEKSDPPSNTIIEGDSVGAAAVAAGLKARAAGPVEKVKFKEVLKRRGGLQEYLECRNMILGLWCKDVSCILPIEECGVTAAPSKDEPQRASLIREIYAFLDQNGYINVGIASRKEKCLPCRDAHSKLSEEKNPEENCVARIADSDGVAFILGRGKASEILTDTRNGAFSDDGKLISEVTEGRKSVMSNRGSEFNTSLESEERTADNDQETDCISVKLPKIMTNLSALSTDPLSNIMDGGTGSVLAPDLKSNSYRVQSAANDYMDGDDHVESEPKVQKKIIVVGAGPAGLTAARHLQRQGFSVTVLEARDRLGGRVYTDRSSLSVPVDLGASIITGVEADVATERRPDPSSLVCAQLGLELTILNSDCPLYDIVTGKKVPADLDEALEAEYNSLLDDMVVLVAHKGERAMRMSLEDGLEYALKRRRMARSTTDAEEIELNASADTSVDTKNGGFDGKYLNGTSSKEDILSPLERRVMDWHFANLEYGCAALLKAVSLPYWNQDDVYGGFGGAHCMIKGGYSSVVESLGEGLHIHLNHVVTEVSYRTRETEESGEGWTEVKVSTSNGIDFFGDAVLITVPLGCLKADTIKFSPSLPEWKRSSIQQLGFGVLNKVVLEFPEVFWDDSVDYFGATAEETKWRGLCFMFWNVKKTVGAPVLIALVVGQAAIDGQNLSSSDHVNHAVMVLRKLFGDALVPNPIASVVTNWGGDPFSHGAYSYVAVGASGEDYDILGRPVENCLFFAGEATCKEHPDTVGGAMMSGLREAVRIIAIMTTGNDYTAEVQVIEAAQRHSDSERNEVRDIMRRLEAVELSNVLYKNSLDEDGMLTKEALVQDMFVSAKTTAGRLHLAKELLKLPVEALKSFSGTREGLSILNSWILDSMGKDGTQLLRHCVRILVRVSTDLLAVRLSGIGKTVKEKVCVHTSRDIRAVASQLVSMWIEVFRKEKASNGGLKLLRHTSSFDSFKTKSSSGKPPVRTTHGAANLKGNVHTFPSAGIHPSSNFNIRKANCKAVKLETITDLKSEIDLPQSLDLVHITDSKMANSNVAISEEEAAAIAAAEAARAAARAAAEAYASSEADCSTLRELPKIPSFHKFARREQYAQMDDTDIRRKKWVGGLLGRQDCISEIDSRNCRVRNWSVDFSATCVNPEGSRLSGDNYTQRSYSNEVACQLNHGEYSGESGAVDSRLTKAWVDSVGSGGVKDYHAIERWQSQAAAADSEFFHPTMHVRDEEDSNTGSKNWKHEGDKQESISSQAAENRELLTNQLKGAERIKQAVVDYVASLLMPLYKTRKIDKEGYKSIMKKSATKVMEQTTDAEKAMAASEFLDFKRKNKIRAFVDRLIERHMVMKPVGKP